VGAARPRASAWLINIPAMWEAPEETEAEVSWARQAFAALEPHMMAGKYVTFMDDDEDPSSTGAYGRTFDRLRAVKHAYGPENVFRLNQNIRRKCRRIIKLYAIILGMDTARKIDWNELEFTEVRPGIFGATVHTPQLTATLYRYGPGSSWEEHQHPQDQITTVLEGVIDFVVDGEPVRLVAGQLAALPGGTPHSATVPEKGAVSLNVFTHRDAPPDA
jgi:quercetin dioxygenase-like cupin family protein